MTLRSLLSFIGSRIINLLRSAMGTKHSHYNFPFRNAPISSIPIFSQRAIKNREEVFVCQASVTVETYFS